MMYNNFKIFPIRDTTAAATLFLLCSTLLIINCNCGVRSRTTPVDNIKDQEIILFLGNPGTGKSTLLNSIFEKPIFKSGISVGKGLTTHQQEYVYDNKLYIDTPGLADADKNKRAQAGIEIEKALKHNANYKLVFVAGLESGRIRAGDLVTINLVCDAIKTNFDYSVIFNKVSDRIIKRTDKVTPLGTKEEKEKFFNQQVEGLLHKKPASVIILKNETSIEDKDNVYFKANDENRKDLLNFLNKLKANNILEDQIGKVYTTEDEAKYEELKQEYEKQLNELMKKLAR